MFISILTNGDIKNIVPDNVYQGSNNANTIYVLAPFASNVEMFINFEIETTGEITKSYKMDAPVEVSNEMNVWKVNVDRVLTQYYGNVKYQIQCMINNQTICTAKGNFRVIEGVDVVLPEIPDEDTYELILQEFSNVKSYFLNGWIEAQALRAYNSEFNYSKNVLTFGQVDGQIYLFKSLIENNKGNSLNDHGAWEKVGIGGNSNSCFIRYSQNPDGTDMVEQWQPGYIYIGFYIGERASENHEQYQWARFVGLDGNNGEPGPQGPQGPAGPQGDSYILTDDDKSQIAKDTAEIVSFVQSTQPTNAVEGSLWIDTDEESESVTQILMRSIKDGTIVIADKQLSYSRGVVEVRKIGSIIWIIDSGVYNLTSDFQAKNNRTVLEFQLSKEISNCIHNINGEYGKTGTIGYFPALAYENLTYTTFNCQSYLKRSAIGEDYDTYQVVYTGLNAISGGGLCGFHLKMPIIMVKQEGGNA